MEPLKGKPRNLSGKKKPPRKSHMVNHQKSPRTHKGDCQTPENPPKQNNTKKGQIPNAKTPVSLTQQAGSTLPSSSQDQATTSRIPPLGFLERTKTGRSRWAGKCHS